MADLERSADEELQEFTRRLEQAGDLANLLALKAFSELVTAGCIEILMTARPPMYRALEGADLSLLTPEERIVMKSTGFTIGEVLPELLRRAADGIRASFPESRRAVTPSEAGSGADIRAGVAAAMKAAVEAALKYEPPVSSCSV